jgi:hypothetical protein
MKFSKRMLLWAVISCLGILFVRPAKAQAVGYGDGILHLGTNGYASIPDSQLQGFNSQTNVSLEVVLNIQANVAGGRWPVLLGKKYSPPFADAGFALSINQGQFQFMGQQLFAVVADGSQQAFVTSRSFQGIVHAVMTWDCQAKVLSLYMDGALEGSVTNTLLSANLQNTQSFQVGGPSNYGQPLQRDVLLGRLWNRVLTAAEVGALWTNFTNYGQHILPAGFNRTALVSEWLMQSMADATHLRDTQGSNALQLQGSAQLWQGNGALALAVPANGATNVPTAVTFKAAGGLATLGATVVGPLQYNFQIDQINTFNSAALIDSGWRADYGTWKPVLQPTTQYFCRVRVRDSASTPQTSGFITTNAFTTKGPSDWYVRPGVYTQFDPNSVTPIATAGIYGRQDGTSYSNAWNGLFSVVWGETGVEAGDNLYVCGTHLYTASNIAFLFNQAVDYIPESGYSTNFPITIRMDSPSGAGVVWGACLNEINGGGTWYGPDANGVYWCSNLVYSADYWASGTNVVLLNRESATTWINDPAATFTTNGVWYVKSPDGSNPAGKICTDGFGYRFNFGRAWYLRFLHCNFFDATPGGEVLSSSPNNDTQTAAPVSSYIIFDTCTMQYNASITLSMGNDHWTIKNSEIGNSPYGIYSFLNLHPAGANYLTVQSNYIHDTGTPRFPHVDGHGIGVQAGNGHLIEDNDIENTGSAIEFWTSSQPMRNHTIRYNFIKNIRVIPNGTAGCGITISGDNTFSAPGLRTGFEIYGNIIMNTGLGGNQPWQGYGIDSGSPDFVDIYNNVLYQDPTGIAVLSLNYPAQARVVNNIIVSSTNLFLQIVGSAASTNLLVDYNLYSPAANASSTPLTVLYNSHDQHSLFGNSSFVSANPSVATNFMLAPTSIAIGVGTPINPLYNFGGSPQVPANRAPDIGAFQSYVIVGQLLPPTGLRVTFTPAN